MQSVQRIRNRGFTLVEIMISMGILGVVMAGLMNVWMIVGFQTRAGNAQLEYTALARRVQHRLMDMVQHAKYAEAIDDDTLHLYDTENRRTTVRYTEAEDLESCLVTVTAWDGTSYDLCHSVTELDDEPIFEMLDTIPRAVMVRLRVGDDLNGDERRYRTGPGHQGVDIRFSAQPRNVQRWYD